MVILLQVGQSLQQSSCECKLLEFVDKSLKPTVVASLFESMFYIKTTSVDISVLTVQLCVRLFLVTEPQGSDMSFMTALYVLLKDIFMLAMGLVYDGGRLGRRLGSCSAFIGNKIF